MGQTQKYIVVDAAGFPTEIYSSEVHGDEIPATAKAISDEQWSDLIANSGRRRWVGGTLVSYDPPAPGVSPQEVNTERQRRIAAGKVIDGVHVTGSDEDARNLMSLALGAQMRLAAGDKETVTTFRDGDNVDHELTPAQLLSLWQQSAAYVSDLYAASWALKAMEPIPEDFASDSHWPN